MNCCWCILVNVQPLATLIHRLFCLRELVGVQRELMSAESALEQARQARHNLLLDCKIQGLPISLLAGSLDEISQLEVGQHFTLCSFNKIK